MVTEEQLIPLYANLGLDGAVTMSAEDVRVAIMERGASIPLVGNLKLRRSRVMQENRMEIVGYTSSSLSAFKAMGCFTEIISWTTRLFIPVDDLDCLDALLTQHKVAMQSEAA